MHKVYGCHRPREGCKLHPVGIRRKAEFFQVVIVPVRGVSCIGRLFQVMLNLDWVIVPVRGVSCIGKYAQKQPCDI